MSVRQSLGVIFTLAGWLLCAPTSVDAQEADSIHGSAMTATPAIAELLDPYQGRLDSSEVAQTIERRNRYTGFPSTYEEHVLAARLWRRAGRPDLALEELARLRPDEVGPLSLLERARVLLETDSLSAKGLEAWWAACESIDEVTRVEVAWDIVAVTTPDERDEWHELDDGSETCAWLRDFWNQRAQRMAMSTDDRIALHYRRLAHAREWYWIPHPYRYKGTSDFHGRPAGLAIDDRGLIFVRLGPPLTDEGFIAGEDGTADLQSGSVSGLPNDGFGRLRPTTGEVQRCWPYWRPGGYRIYCFYAGRLGGLVPGSPGTNFFHQYVVNSNLPETVIRHRVRSRGGGLDAPWERALNRLENRAWERHGVVRTRENIEEALEEIPDVPAVRSNVRLRVETLRFLNPASNEWQVWTVASVRAGDLRPSGGEVGRERLSVSGRYSVIEKGSVQIRELPRIDVRADALGDDAGIVLKSVFTAESGRLPLTVVVEDLNEPNGGNWVHESLNIPAIGGLPQLSDIAVAQEEGGTWTRDGRTFLRVTPTHITNADGSIHTYFEVYGVDAGGEYDVELRLAPEESAERIWRLEPDDLGFRLQFSAEMEGEIGRHHLRLDLSDTEPGRYTLAVRIQVAESEAYSLPAVTEIFVPERG